MSANELGLGRKIKERREQLGMSLQDLAYATDSSKGYLWEIENRDGANPSVKKLLRIAEALEVTTAFLLDSQGIAASDDAAVDQFAAMLKEKACRSQGKGPQRVARSGVAGIGHQPPDARSRGKRRSAGRGGVCDVSRTPRGSEYGEDAELTAGTQGLNPDKK